MAVNSSLLQHQLPLSWSLFLTGINEGAHILAEFVNFLLHMLRYTLLKLTSSFLPAIQGPLFLITMLWGLLNYRLYCWWHQSWLKEIHDTRAPKLTFVYNDNTRKLKLSAEWWLIFSNCVNINKYNIFLLGLISRSSPGFSSCLFWYAETLVKFMYTVFMHMLCKPPDPWTRMSKGAQHLLQAMMLQAGILQQQNYLLKLPTNALSSLVSFDTDSNTLIVMDKCASNHIFGDPQDFIGGITLMAPVDVTGLSKAQATGYGKVNIIFKCDKEQQHAKVLHNVWYSPSVPIHMISISQLGMDLRASTFSCGPFSIFKWGDISTAIPHRPPSRIPLMPMMVRNNNKDDAGYNEFHAAFTCIQCDSPEHNALCLLAGQENNEPTAALTTEVSTCKGVECTEHADPDATITKLADFSVVIQQARETQAMVLTTAQRELLSWHCHLGHLPFKQLLELAKDGRITKHLANCQVPKCPACLFSKMTKKPWKTKGKDHRRIQKRR